MKLSEQNMNPEAKLFKVAENQYIMDNNGMQMFLQTFLIPPLTSWKNGNIIAIDIY